MAGGLFKRLEKEGEQRALLDSWDTIARMAIVVALLAAAIWALCSFLRWAVHASSDRLLSWLEAHASSPRAWGVLLGLLVAGGLLRGALARRPAWKQTEGDGIDIALDNFHCTYDHEPNDPQPRYDRGTFGLALRKIAATIMTLGTGASGGLEAPVVMVGESVGAGAARIFAARSEHELRTYQLAGIAAAVATLLHAPFAAALFAIEMAYGDRVIYRKFAYALLAGLTAYVLNNQLLGARPMLLAPPHAAAYTLPEYAITALVAVAVSAPIALGFGLMTANAARLVQAVHPAFRGSAGALGCGLVALGLWFLVGVSPHHVLGVGTQTLGEVLGGGGFPWWVLVAAILGKMLTTGLTIQSGGSAGMLIPSMFLGGLSGALTAQGLVAAGLFPESGTAIFVVVGIASSLVAVIGVPLAAIALVLEMFGSTYGPPAMLACGLTYVLTARLRVYKSQQSSPAPDADETGHA